MAKRSTKAARSVIKFRPGSRIPGARKDAIASELDRIYRRDGRLTPESVVAAAQARRSPLHHYIFKESDEAAAHQHRLTLARHLICSVTIVRQDNSEPEKMYVCVSSNKEDAGTYVPLAEALSDERMSEIVLGRALGELRTFREKYSRLQAMRPVFQAADKVQTAYARKAVSQRKRA